MNCIAMRVSAWMATAALALSLTGCGYNDFQRLDEQTTSAWSEVLNQYQRRADLVPNLVATVKGFAAQEERVLTEVTNARSRVGQMNISADQASDPETLKKFQAAQGELSGALSRLLVVSENYPELKSNENFRDLQVQLEGTENRVTVARNRYIQSVQAYNTHIRQFPVNITAKLFGYQPKANFSVENEAAISKAPTVEFAPATPAPAPGG